MLSLSVDLRLTFLHCAINHTTHTHVQEAPKSMLDDDADLLDGLEDAELL